MVRKLTLFVLLALVALPLAAQGQKAPPAEGDLIPRSGTLMYMVSDRPDVLYRLFGVDKKGGWRLRGFAQDSLNKEFAEKLETPEARRAQAILDYIFGGYEAIEQAELGLVDVTLDGPKYLLHLKLKPGRKLDLKPQFLSEYLSRTIDYRDMKYLMYRIDQDGPANPEEKPVEPPEPKPGEKGPGPRQQNYFGMNRYYVAEIGGSIIVSNFDSTMREAIDRHLDRDTSESLSGRPEFIEWRRDRKKHDLSVFVVGREIQNLVERLMPSKEQAGLDAQKIYNEIDAWMQFREYRYVVFDLDYEEAVRGLTMAATLKTRRPTKLLERFAIESGKFTTLRYVPAGAVVTVGAQLGNARQTWNSMVELGRDLEKVASELESSGIMPWGRRSGRDVPPDSPPDPKKPEQPPEDNPWLPKSVGPMKLLDQMGEILRAQQAGETEEAQDPENLDGMLKQLDKALAEFGTSLEEILSVVGGQVVLFVAIDAEVAKANFATGVRDMFAAGQVGLVLHLADPDKAAAILARAAEKDPEGAFKGMNTVNYQGVKFQVSPQRPYGYAITKDALLVTVLMDDSAEDSSGATITSLKAMVDASLKGERRGFTAEGSKFLEVDWGQMSRVQNEAKAAAARRLDRFSRPAMGTDFGAHMKDFTFALRTREAKDGIEVAMRVTGLPDLGTLLEDAKEEMFEGGNSESECYSYSEENLRGLGMALRRQAEAKGSLDLAELVKTGKLRAGHLQTPFDSRWKGAREGMGWLTIDQIKRDDKGNLPGWINQKAAETVEANEKEGWVSFKFAPGDVAEALRNYSEGMIVLYQEKPETLGGHLLLYADGQMGWLHADVLAQALKLNADGKAIPAQRRRYAESQGATGGEGGTKPTEPRNPWLPEDEGKGDREGKEDSKPAKIKPPKGKTDEGDGIDRPND
ncbi:MAG: hypothetical protein KF754_09170 [Planctomycetes bacterium]|nr:hypothetical protein [Planctomycetota bacterium]